MSRHRSTLLMLLVGFVCAGAEAGVYQQIFRGLQIAATPTGFPLFTTGNGTRVNGARTGRVRIVPSGPGPGYQLEMDRTFGVDSTGRPEIFYLGGMGQLQLNGGMQWTAGYNGKKFRTVRSDFVLQNLVYDLSTNFGVQDATLTGVLNVDSFMRINPLGFYTIEFDVANTNSALELDGIIIRDDEELNFDIGPISVEGNFFVDGLAALLTGLGVDTSQIEGYDPRSPIDRINDEIERALQAAASPNLSNDTTEFAPLLLTSILGQDEDTARRLVDGLVEETVQNSAPPALSAGDETATQNTIPEPATALLLVAGSGLLLRRSRN
jgi:hypothetical protein